MCTVFHANVCTTAPQLAEDDEAAEAEAAAMGGVPGYCSDRYYRAAAGGGFCAKFER